MNPPSCCKHCDPRCKADAATLHFHGEGWYAVWATGRCPACAEARRIAGRLESDAAHEQEMATNMRSATARTPPSCCATPPDASGVDCEDAGLLPALHRKLRQPRRLAPGQ